MTSQAQSLPAYLQLYIGMPVILRYKNISTELGITNGSQGIVRQIETDILPLGLTTCTCAIVEFPESKINLPHLPSCHFPVTPIAWTFTTKLQGELIQATRHQLPIQPAFALPHKI
jgi:hypothetical protein